MQERGAKEGHTNEYDELHAAGIDIPGRLTLNLWRLLRTELKLGIYTQVHPACLRSCCLWNLHIAALVKSFAKLNRIVDPMPR